MVQKRGMTPKQVDELLGHHGLDALSTGLTYAALSDPEVVSPSWPTLEEWVNAVQSHYYDADLVGVGFMCRVMYLQSCKNVQGTLCD